MIDNALSIIWHAREKDSPAKRWWNAEPWHPAIGRALRINRGEEGGVYALHPFRMAKISGAHHIVAAWPAPLIFDPPSEDWLDVEQVIAWNPLTDTAFVMGDPDARIVGALDDEANEIHASPRAFFQAWAIRRAQFAIRRQASHRSQWDAKPPERDLIPGALMLAKPQDIRWNPAAMPEHITCIGCNPQDINRAILRAARLPRAVSAGERIAA